MATVVSDTTACPLCSSHSAEHPTVAHDRRDDLIPWAILLTGGVVVASLGIGVERWFGLGAVAGLVAGAGCAWITVRSALRRRRAGHARELAAMAEDGDSRVATVIRQFEWAVNDVVKLKRDNERMEAVADALMERARQRERYVEKLERQLFETRERLVSVVATSADTERPEFDPLAEAMAGIVPFRWALHNDRYQVNLELECGITSHRPTRVRLVDAEGNVVITSGTPMWNEDGHASFTLATPPTDLILDLDAGREPRYTFEALSDYEWKAVRLEDSGKRTKIVTDKQGRLYRVSDAPDAAQLLAPSLTTLAPLN